MWCIEICQGLTWTMAFVRIAIFVILPFLIILMVRGWRSTLSRWLHYLGYAALFGVLLSVFSMFWDTKINVPENTIMMEIRDNEPTGVIRKAGENQGRLVHKGYVSMEMEREITVIREGSVVAGSFIIEATIRVADPNKTFRAWRDSDRRPYSGDAADGKIIRLIEAEYQQAIVGFEPWDLKNILDQEKISRANEDIEAELEKNGLVIEVMNVKLFTEMFLGGIDNR